MPYHNLVFHMVWDGFQRNSCRKFQYMALYLLHTIRKEDRMRRAVDATENFNLNFEWFNSNWLLAEKMLLNNITLNKPRLFIILAMVLSCAKYIQRDRFGDKFNCVLFTKRSRISFNRNPDFNFFISVVDVKIWKLKLARYSKSPPAIMISSAQIGSLRSIRQCLFWRIVFMNESKLPHAFTLLYDKRII